jgi:DNA-binding NtrC family response regulator
MSEQKRILVVEDDAEWRENILRDALEDDGYQINTCASYEEAVTILDEVDFDLVVVDVNLTGVPGNRDGIRIVERIAETGRRTAVIVVSSSDTLRAARESVGHFGSIAFMDKTAFDLVDFIDSVADALS